MLANRSLVNRIIYFFWVLWVLWLPPAMAQESTTTSQKPFTIGLALQPNSLDPHAKQILVANYNILSNIFEPLYRAAQDGAVERVLVESEILEAPDRWLFTLKPNVYFHNGKRLTSEDVIATFEYLYQLPEDHPFRKFLGEGLQFNIINDQKFQIITPRSIPDFPYTLDIPIRAKGFQFDNEKLLANPQLLIGTGPYRLLSHDKLHTFKLESFPQYHGLQPYIQKLNIRIITDYATRLQAFLDNSIQFMDNVLPKDIDAILARRPSHFSMPPGTKFYHMTLDQYREQSPDITDHQGKPLLKNPLKDHRVRAAISQAIDRQALVTQFYTGGGAIPSGQLVPEGFKGHMPALTASIYAPDKARSNLKDAGYPKGFRLVLHDKHARRPILEAIAEMLSEVGIATTVETLPPVEYFPNLANHHYSAGLSFFNAYGIVLNMLNQLIISNGSANAGRYNSPDFDQQLAQARQAPSQEIRYRDYGYLVEYAMQDYAVIPLYFINDAWAIDERMIYITRPDQIIRGQQIYPANK